MWLLLKTAAGTFSTVVVIASSIAATMGVAGWFGMFMSTRNGECTDYGDDTCRRRLYPCDINHVVWDAPRKR